MGKMEMHKYFGWETWKRRPLGRPRRRWKDNRIDLSEIGLEGVDRMYLSEDRYLWLAVVSAVMNLRFS